MSSDVDVLPIAQSTGREKFVTEEFLFAQRIAHIATASALSTPRSCARRSLESCRNGRVRSGRAPLSSHAAAKMSFVVTGASSRAVAAAPTAKVTTVRRFSSVIVHAARKRPVDPALAEYPTVPAMTSTDAPRRSSSLSQRVTKASAPSARGSAVVPRAGAGIVTFLALSGVAVGATVLSQKAIEKRLDDEIARAKKNGIDLEDLYFDTDVPGDAYPFGDAEGMDWVPKDWKPPKKGDPRFLPNRMLGQVQVRNKMFDLQQQCKAKGIDVSDISVPFDQYEGEFDSNQKRMVEMRRRLGLN